MHKNQSGFSTVAIILLVAVVGVFGFAGWRVYDKQNNQPPAADKVSQQKSTDNAPKELKEYKSKDLSLAFQYPAEWGEVKVTKGERPLENGEEHSISFTENNEVKASLRSKYYKAADGTGRGGAYWDPPLTFEQTLWQDAEWDPFVGASISTIERNKDRIVVAYCDGFTASAGLKGFVNLGGFKFDTIMFYQLIRSPKPDGSGADMSGCEDPAQAFASDIPEFTKFIGTVKSL